MTAARKTVRVCVDLDPTMNALLLATVQHTGKTRDQVIGEALKALFVALPRLGD